jgi:hypothetical protein
LLELYVFLHYHISHITMTFIYSNKHIDFPVVAFIIMCIIYSTTQMAHQYIVMNFTTVPLYPKEWLNRLIWHSHTLNVVHRNLWCLKIHFIHFTYKDYSIKS